MSEFDYGGEIAKAAGFTKAAPGTRNARLYAMLRLGNFSATFKGEEKDPAPFAVAVFHLLGSTDKTEDGHPMFFSKDFPMKDGSKSFLHKTFIPAMGGMTKHKNFPSMIGGFVSITLNGSKEAAEDGSPKYTNFGSIGVISDDTIELLEGSPKYAALENPVGFLRESELTEAALELLHPQREFAGILMQTVEFKAGTHPCQELIQKMYDKNPDRYQYKKSDADSGDDDAGQQNSAANGPAAEPAAPVEQLTTEQEY